MLAVPPVGVVVSCVPDVEYVPVPEVLGTFSAAVQSQFEPAVEQVMDIPASKLFASEPNSLQVVPASARQLAGMVSRTEIDAAIVAEYVVMSVLNVMVPV